MTPKEKAKDLFDKMCWAIVTEKTYDGYFRNVIYAKQCALIAVDEILNLNDIDMEYSFYVEVKQEIENI